MAKGGRYLNTNKNTGKKTKKKSSGFKVFIVIVVILALLAVGGYLAFRLFMGSMLGNVNRAEFEEKNQDKSYEDLMADIYGGAVSGADGEAVEEDVYIPTGQEMQPEEESELPQETTEAVAETTEAAA